jgi:DNA recombination protein RmuC
MVLYLLIGIVIGALAMLAVVRPRIVRLRTVERERDLLEVRLDSKLQSDEDRFRALSAEVMKSSNEQFLTLAKQALGTYQTDARNELEKRERAVAQLVAPITEQLGKVDSRLERLDRDRAAGASALQQQLRTMVESQDKLRGETGALVAALRKPQARGRWGEMQLRNVVEMAGMVAYCDFAEQVTVRDDDDRALRPDLIVNLPGGKKVVVDAKAPLQAFLDAYDATEEADRERHMADHARMLREHIRKLSARGYWAQFPEAPDFVVLFLPGEHFHNAALEIDPSLIQQGVEQQVLIATPTTLIALLRAVHYGWQQERVAENAREISDLGRELHSRLGSVAGHVQKLGRQLGSAVDAYNAAVGSLETRVLVSARRFTDHGVVGEDKQIAPLEPIDRVPRAPQAPELAPVEDAVVEAPRTLGAA